MLMDGRTLPPESRLWAKACIVGTGMGALSVAHVLVEAGIDVVLIEAGPVAATRREPPAIEVENTGRSFRLHTSRGLEAGGGTAFWHGICAQLDEIDFRKREWVPHSGWPIGSSELAPYYRKAWVFCVEATILATPVLLSGLRNSLGLQTNCRAKSISSLRLHFAARICS